MLLNYINDIQFISKIKIICLTCKQFDNHERKAITGYKSKDKLIVVPLLCFLFLGVPPSPAKIYSI